FRRWGDMLGEPRDQRRVSLEEPLVKGQALLFTHTKGCIRRLGVSSNFLKVRRLAARSEGSRQGGLRERLQRQRFLPISGECFAQTLGRSIAPSGQGNSSRKRRR